MPTTILDRYISHNGKKWLVHSEDGDVLGEHDNKEDAEKQLAAIEINKKKAKKSENSLLLTPERRMLLPFEAELRVDQDSEGQKFIHGYAAKFGKMSRDLGGFVERIHPRAFENALKTSDVRALRNHDPDKLLGRQKSGTLKLDVDDTGLRYKIAIDDDSSIHRDTISAIKRGDIDGSSFSFTTDSDGDDWDHATSPPVRTLTNVRDLFDVGPVAWPAYEDTEAYARNCRSYQQFLATHKNDDDRKKAEQAERLRKLDARLAERLKKRK